MKFTKLLHQTKINVLCTVNLQIFHEINGPIISPLSSYPEDTRRNGDVTVVGMSSILVATFSFLTPERNHLERSATSQIKA